MSRRAPILALALAAAALLAGCGGPSGDLFGVQRSGDVPGAMLRLVVDDGGGASCNGHTATRMPDDLLVEAREIERDLEEPAAQGLNLAAGAQSVLRYDVATPDGRVRFADDSRGGPPVLDRLAFFMRRVAQQVCHLPR